MLKKLVFEYNGQPYTDSILVAEIFNKTHKDVLRAINKLGCSEDFNLRNFDLVLYKDSLNRNHDIVLITKDGFSLLMAEFNGKKAMNLKFDFFEAFNQMQKNIDANNPTAILNRDIPDDTFKQRGTSLSWWQITLN